MKKVVLAALLLLALPALADNYIEITVNPGTAGVTVTYYYTIALTIPVFDGRSITVTVPGDVVAPGIPVSTTKEITQTPVLLYPVTVTGELYVTAEGNFGTATGNQTFTMTLSPGQSNTVSIHVDLSNGGYIDAYVNLFVSKLSISGVALAAAALAGLLGRRAKRSRQ